MHLEVNVHLQSLVEHARAVRHRRMESLQKRFGKLLGAHRRQVQITQPQLAERVGVSVDTIKKLEAGIVAPSFAMIEKIASDLQIDPAELFTSQVEPSNLRRQSFRDITDKLAVLDDRQLEWLQPIIDAALSAKR